jgi:hypothetical protein
MALASNGARRYLAAAVYLLGLTFSAIVALGSQHGGRALNDATAAALTGERGRIESQYRRADAALSKLPETRPVAVIQSELAALLKDPRLNECYGWLMNSRLRAVCVERVEPLRAELANANERQRLTGELASASEALAGLTVAKPANADANALGRYLEALGVNIPRDRLTDLLNLLTVASVELAGGIALALGHRSPHGSVKKQTASTGVSRRVSRRVSTASKRTSLRQRLGLNVVAFPASQASSGSVSQGPSQATSQGRSGSASQEASQRASQGSSVLKIA